MLANGPQNNVMPHQGPPNVSTPPGPGGEIPPSAQQSIPMSNFNSNQPIHQGPYRGPVMPGQGPNMNREFFGHSLSIN